jgi:hypothetical protein
MRDILVASWSKYGSRVLKEGRGLSRNRVRRRGPHRLRRWEGSINSDRAWCGRGAAGVVPGVVPGRGAGRGARGLQVGLQVESCSASNPQTEETSRLWSSGRGARGLQVPGVVPEASRSGRGARGLQVESCSASNPQTEETSRLWSSESCRRKTSRRLSSEASAVYLLYRLPVWGEAGQIPSVATRRSTTAARSSST